MDDHLHHNFKSILMMMKYIYAIFENVNLYIFDLRIYERKFKNQSNFNAHQIFE